jgi:hypothetical protein
MTVFDVLTKFFSKIAFDFGVTFGACGVDVYFPADAAGVGAFSGDATERIVKIRCSENHAVKFRNDVPILLSNKKLT